MFEEKKMLYNCLFLLLLHLLIHQLTAVNMCTNTSAASTDVKLNLMKGTSVSDCDCIVKLQNIANTMSRPLLTFQVVHFSGCKYKLYISYNNFRNEFSCSNNSPFGHMIHTDDEIKLYMESTTTYENDTDFVVKITSNVTAVGGPLLRLECFLPNTTTNTTESTDIKQSTVTASTQINSITISSTTAEMNGTSDASYQSGELQDIAKIGGAIGGSLLLVLVVVIIFVWVWRRKKAVKKNYDTPSDRLTYHSYTNVDIVRHGRDYNSSEEGISTANNEGHKNAISVSSQKTNNTKQIGDDANEMEIIVNDLYISSDDVMDSTASHDDDTNQKPQTEYAVIKKDRKSNNIPKDLSSEGQGDHLFVIGSQGDEYALVKRN